MTVVIGVRHGEVHNPDGVIYAGLSGFGLSDLGRQQARAVGRSAAGLPLAAVYSSPLERALETAEAVAVGSGIRPVVDDRLHEWRYWSRWAGMTWERLRDTDADAYLTYLDDPGLLRGPETFAELSRRVGAWLADVRSAHPDGIVVGVTHLEPLRAGLVTLLGLPTSQASAIRVGLAEAVRLAPDPAPVPGPIDELVGGL